ncbi:hypothetical protein ElyMa_001136000 [Elysia marginata]|uniref:Uncharacterized protein n=1 Tax=Elysia marginata TaxID=1093978 RepID=A0AAV4I1X0_9GAST|nr:hypothetical protein ElyMa_001136000 [Elysia marginata]
MVWLSLEPSTLYKKVGKAWPNTAMALNIQSQAKLKISRPKFLLRHQHHPGNSQMLFQPASYSNSLQQVITADDEDLETVESMINLESFMSSNGSLDKEIAVRISKAIQSVG